MVRAAHMGGLSLFALQVGRRQAGLNSLAFVAAIMALFNPQILGDAGYQLSFGATLGLVLYAEPLSGGFVTLAGLYAYSRTMSGAWPGRWGSTCSSPWQRK